MSNHILIMSKEHPYHSLTTEQIVTKIIENNKNVHFITDKDFFGSLIHRYIIY